jgi:hypothetical protein
MSCENGAEGDDVRLRVSYETDRPPSGDTNTPHKKVLIPFNILYIRPLL